MAATFKNKEPIATGTEAGIEWATFEAPVYGAVNGYVRLPEGHPWLAFDLQMYDGPDVDVNGGITYGPTDDRWIGFDTLHAGDYWPGVPYGPFRGDTRWDAAMVADETKKLARQAAEAVA